MIAPGRRGRAALAACCAFFLASAHLALKPPPPTGPVASSYRAVPVPLESGRPDRKRVGALDYLGGWSLRSEARWFGGVSGLAAGPSGLTAISDAGLLFRFDRPDGRGRRLLVTPLEEELDAEALASDGRALWIALEQRNAIWRFEGVPPRATARAAPDAMRDWSWNSGPEALTRLPDGRFLLIAEDRKGDRPSPALLFLGDPAAQGTRAIPLRFRPPPGYRATDAAALPDGRVLILVRAFSIGRLFTAKLLLADVPAATAGGEIKARVVASFEPPLTRDNFEALAVTQESGRTIVWLASDDNYLPLQRTLLMKFAWGG